MPSMTPTTAPSGFIRFCTALLVVACGLPPCASQTAKPAAAQTPTGNEGFAIESEMLTYRALQTNSETVGCDIAAYLYGQPVTFSGNGEAERCNVAAPSANAPGVIILPFDQSVVNAFQLWRANMSIMAELKLRTSKYCGKPAAGSQEQGGKGAAGAVALDALGPAGGALGLAQGVLNAFATQVEVSSVAGTIKDQAFLNGVARQLRVLGVPVLSPSAFAPYSLSGFDLTTSPFLSALTDTLKLRDCMADSARTDPTDTVLAGELAELNLYIAGLGSTTAKGVGNTGPTSDITPPASSIGADRGATNKASAPAGTTSAATPLASTPSPSGIADILLADGLAQRLGFAATGQTSTANPWQHILFLKALESGGTVTRVSNIFGTRIRYSGGSVGTFALLHRDGTLECSGNVFDFGGNVSAQKFEEMYRHYSPHLSSQLVFVRGNCAVNH
jgi:hypothetical protein